MLFAIYLTRKSDSVDVDITLKKYVWHYNGDLYHDNCLVTIKNAKRVALATVFALGQFFSVVL